VGTQGYPCLTLVDARDVVVDGALWEHQDSRASWQWERRPHDAGLNLQPCSVSYVASYGLTITTDATSTRQLKCFGSITN
jgi:hypothetical protein